MQAILNMTSPKTVKEVQKLIGRIVTLNRFVSRATDKCLPFFKTLKQAFAWTDECEAAFQELKRYLSNPPQLSSSMGGENLYLYLAVLAMAVSATLIQEEERKQLPVCYVSQAFQGAEAKYPRIEKNCICVNSSLAQIATILSGEPHLSDDGSTHQEVHEQA